MILFFLLFFFFVFALFFKFAFVFCFFVFVLFSINKMQLLKNENHFVVYIFRHTSYTCVVSCSKIHKLTYSCLAVRRFSTRGIGSSSEQFYTRQTFSPFSSCWASKITIKVCEKSQIGNIKPNTHTHTLTEAI